MSVDAEFRSGSTLTVTVATGDPRRVVQEPETHRRAELMGAHILVVDDEEGIRSGMRTLLGDWGCQVTVAGSEDEAKTLLADLLHHRNCSFAITGFARDAPVWRRLTRSEPIPTRSFCTPRKCQSTKPSRLASLTQPVRLSTSKMENKVETWPLTVLSATPSWSAMALLLRPSATSLST